MEKDQIESVLSRMYVTYEDQVMENDLTKDDFKLKEATLRDIAEALGVKAKF